MLPARMHQVDVLEGLEGRLRPDARFAGTRRHFGALPDGLCQLSRASLAQNLLEQRDRVGTHCLRQANQLWNRDLALLAFDHAYDGVRPSDSLREIPLRQPRASARCRQHGRYGSRCWGSQRFQACSELRSTLNKP
jgi:hypothetical protein